MLKASVAIAVLYLVVGAGLAVPHQPAGFADPKATPTPKPCSPFCKCDADGKILFCQLFEEPNQVAIIVKPSPTPPPGCMYDTTRQCTSGGQLPPAMMATNLIPPKATPTPNWCCDFMPSRYCTLCPPA